MNTEKPCKIVLIGESGVGKTSIIARYVNDRFDGHTVTTVGATSFNKKVTLQNGTIYDARIWDTSGQEQFRSLCKIFYRDAQIAILVYDITSRNTFDQIKYYWLNQLRNEIDGVLLVVCGNKYDLKEQKEVPEDEAMEFARSNKAMFKLVSADDLSQIQDLFITALNKYDKGGIQSRSDSIYAMHRPNSFRLKRDNKKKDNDKKNSQGKTTKCCGGGNNK